MAEECLLLELLRSRQQGSSMLRRIRSALRFPVDQRQKAGEKSEGWKLPSCGRLAAFLLLLVNKSSLAHHDDATGLCNACKTWLEMPSEFKNNRESFGGLQAPAHWLP